MSHGQVAGGYRKGHGQGVNRDHQPRHDPDHEKKQDRQHQELTRQSDAERPHGVQADHLRRYLQARAEEVHHHESEDRKRQ